MTGRRGGRIWKTRDPPVSFFVVPGRPGMRKATAQEVKDAAQRGKARFPSRVE
jgi:hypothetical protein